MGKEIVTFGDIEVEEQKFHQHKSPISIYVVNIDRIVVSNKVPCSKVAKVVNILLGSNMILKKLCPFV